MLRPEVSLLLLNQPEETLAVTPEMFLGSDWMLLWFCVVVCLHASELWVEVVSGLLMLNKWAATGYQTEACWPKDKCLDWRSDASVSL